MHVKVPLPGLRDHDADVCDCEQGSMRDQSERPDRLTRRGRLSRPLTRRCLSFSLRVDLDHVGQWRVRNRERRLVTTAQVAAALTTTS